MVFAFLFQNSEIAVYTELMFGAVGVKKKENQTKIHFIK